MSSYTFHPDAFADLDEICEYIAQDNVDAADRVLADIHSTLTTLAGSPQIGHRRLDLTARPLRFTSSSTVNAIAPAGSASCGSIPSPSGRSPAFAQVRYIRPLSWRHHLGTAATFRRIDTSPLQLEEAFPEDP
jgi:plasmid stabilization system protein ParE